jgi:hypothetical protein
LVQSVDPVGRCGMRIIAEVALFLGRSCNNGNLPVLFIATSGAVMMGLVIKSFFVADEAVNTIESAGSTSSGATLPTRRLQLKVVSV